MTLSFGSSGPLLNAVITPSAPLLNALQKNKQSVPAPIPCILLIDTGASTTCLDQTILSALQINPTGQTLIHTPSSGGDGHSCPMYDVGIFIPGQVAGSLLHFVNPVPVVGTNFKIQGIQGLLGRDVLKNACLFYNGTTNLYTLSF